MLKAIIFNGYSDQGKPSAERAGGAYRIATHLRKSGWDIEVVDYLVHWSFEDLVKLFDLRYSQGKISWVGFSSTWNYRHPNLRNLCFYIKRSYPDVKIIIGGNTNFNIDVKANYYVYGFGEYAVDAILKYEFGNGNKPTGRPHWSGWAVDALSFYPAWPLDDYTSEYEDRDYLQPDDVVTLELSRGCRFKCKYCNFPVLGVKDDTSMSEEVMYQYLSSMYDRWGIKNYNIADETVNDRNSKLEKLSSAVQRCEFKPNFGAFTRLDLFNSHPEQMELMAGARIWGQFYGIETFNHRSGKVIGKGLDPEVNKRLMLEMRKYMFEHVGVYRGTASFIAGLPYETPDDLAKTHQWLSDNWRDEHWHVWLLTIPEEKNFKLSAFGEDFSKYGYSRMTDEEIKQYVDLNANEHARQGLGMLDQVIWKNDQGNYFTFHDLAEKYDGWSGEVECRNGNFTVWSRLSLGYSPEEAISVGTNTDTEQDKILASAKHRAYINSKLTT
jgi:hypothetical protein